MKKLNASNRIGLCLNSTLLTLSLALLVSTPALGPAREYRGNTIHPALKAGSAHLSGHTGGPMAMSWWWIRR